MGWLRDRYEVRYERGIFSQQGYLAGCDGRRLEELERALEEDDVAAIVCARGGYGISRYVHRIDWSVLRRAPRWIVGFSDVTALHVEAAKQAVGSLHAANLTGLGRGDARAREQFLACLEQPTARRCWTDLRPLHRGAGSARGPLFGGNLALLHACAAAGALEVPEGSVMLLEDIGERPYRLDRMLSTLRAGGHFDHTAAFLVGELCGCQPGVDGVTAEQVFLQVLAPLGVPVLCNAPVGHGSRNEAVVLGGSVRVVTQPGGTEVLFNHDES